MSAALIERLRACQRELVDELRSEYYCDDVEPPPEAFGWSEQKLRDYFECGGESPPCNVSDAAAAKPSPVVAPQLEPSLPCILLVGDSITENALDGDVNKSEMNPDYMEERFLKGRAEAGMGWAALLARDYGRRCDVLTRGYSGYNTRWILSDLQAGKLALPSSTTVSVKAITLMLGSNDHVRPADPMHVPVDEYERNLGAIVANLSERYPAAELLLMTPPPCDAAKFKKMWKEISNNQYDGAARGEERLVPYLLAGKRVAQRLKASGAKVRLVDVHDEFIARAKAAGDASFGECLWDGLHMNAQGEQHIYKIVAKALVAAGVAPLDHELHRPHSLHMCYPTRFDHDGNRIKR